MSRLPIISTGWAIISGILVLAVVIGWPHYMRFQEQFTRRNCAHQIEQQQVDSKSAVADWEAQCQLKRDEYYKKQAEEYEHLLYSSAETKPSPSPTSNLHPINTNTLTKQQKEYQQIRERLEESGRLQRARDSFEYNSMKEARQATIDGICDIPLGPKPTPFTITPDEETKAIGLCMERKGYSK